MAHGSHGYQIWLLPLQDAWVSIQSIIDHYSTYQDVFQPYAGPGHWNDPDMVRVAYTRGVWV